MTKPKTCDGCNYFQNGKCATTPGIAYEPVPGHTGCVFGEAADFTGDLSDIDAGANVTSPVSHAICGDLPEIQGAFMDKTTSGSCTCMQHNETKFQVPSYDSYYAFKKERGILSLDLSGARLILDSGRDPHDLYHDLQSVFCELMAYELRYFMEN